MKQKRFFAALAAFALLAGGCSSGGSDDKSDPTPTPEEVNLVLTATPTEITADGTDAATLKLTADGVEVAAGRYQIYNAQNQVVSTTFTTKEAGIYSFYAVYNKQQSNTVTVTAKAVDNPQPEPTPTPGDQTLPADPKPESTNFVRRVMLTQFTGLWCGYCPFMINAINEALTDQTLASKVVWTAAHSQEEKSDPTYCPVALYAVFGIGSFPTAMADMATTMSNSSASAVTKLLNEAYSRVNARGGIAAASSYDSASRTLTVTAEVKAAEKRQFRIGLWVLEDGIVAKQSNYGAPGDWSAFVHNDCIRQCDSSAENNHTGYDLGDLDAGATATKTFSFTLRDGLKAENCRVALFITTPEVSGSSKAWRVNNVITMPLTGQSAYQYAE